MPALGERRSAVDRIEVHCVLHCLLRLSLCIGCLAPIASGRAQAATLTVPGQHATIQAAIDAAVDGDTVQVANGTWIENLTIDGKAISLVSDFTTTEDPADIANTIIDGGGGAFVIQIGALAGPTTTIIGFTIQNGDDGIRPYAKFNLFDSRITQTNDGIDYENGSGGLVRRSTIDANGDDGIDLDDDVELTIEDSTIVGNRNDGIEIRLNPYLGPTLKIVIRNNLIAENGLRSTPNGDGIQLIEYTPGSAREFTIERNVFRGNAQAGIGMMCCENTTEDFEGASLLETIFVFDNTFIGNDHGITGGDNTVVINNIFLDTTNIALKRVDGNSIAAYNLFYDNGTDASESNVDVPSSVYADPNLDASYQPPASSPAVDAGTATFTWKYQIVLHRLYTEFAGTAPDIGAREFSPSPVPATGVVVGVVLALALGVSGRADR